MELSNKDKRWLDLALKVAKTSLVYPQKHGAVVIKSGRVLSVATNVYKNDPWNLSEEHVRLGGSVHAEMAALRGLKDLHGVKIYVARWTRSGKAGLSKPCKQCQEVLDALGIPAIYTVDSTSTGV